MISSQLDLEHLEHLLEGPEPLPCLSEPFFPSSGILKHMERILDNIKNVLEVVGRRPDGQTPWTHHALSDRHEKKLSEKTYKKWRLESTEPVETDDIIENVGNRG